MAGRQIFNGFGHNEFFELVAEMFNADNPGYLRPGKSESPNVWFDGREEKREKLWDEWERRHERVLRRMHCFFFENE